MLRDDQTPSLDVESVDEHEYLLVASVHYRIAQHRAWSLRSRMVSSRHENLWLAFGHDHTGMVAGPMTGRIVAGMITGPMPNIDVTPYRADRFRVGND